MKTGISDLKRATSILDSTSGYFFLTGFITARLKNIPIIVVSSAFNLVSLFAYLVGYVAWYLAALLYPDHPRKHNYWYGFAQFKEQYQIAALLGAIATIMCLMVPLLIIPTAWLYAVSNLIWSISEYHKKENPSLNDEQYSSTRQSLYLHYALLVTTSSILTAIAATTVLFPPAAFVVITATTIISVGLTMASLYYWGTCIFCDHPPDRVAHSYSKLSDQLSFALDDVPAPDNTPVPEQKKEETGTHVKHEMSKGDDLRDLEMTTCKSILNAMTQAATVSTSAEPQTPNNFVKYP